ncbi:MAG: hypothetical protein CVV63_03160 [Tenericutes bacterium HGW-Tenericutes-8]|nr:MAG: hypothetical protein CVV63_03160 [Tenericutes bacterium HGW-Tenericutes-8]
MKKLVIIGTSLKNMDILKDILNNNEFFSEVTLLNQADKPTYDAYKDLVIQTFKNQKLSFELKFSSDITALKDSDYILLSLNSVIDNDMSTDHPIVMAHQQAIKLIPEVLSWIERIKTNSEFAYVINVTEPVGLITEAVCRYGDIDNFISLNGNYDHMKTGITAFFKDTYKDLILNVAGLYDDAYIINVYNRKNDILDKVIDKVESYNLEQGSSCGFIKHLGLIPCQRRSLDLPFLEDNNNVMVGKSFLNYVRSIEKDLRGYQVVNISNRGHILDLPENCAIEVTARITKSGAKPMHIGHLPLQIRGSIQHLKAYEELLVDGIYESNLSKMNLALVLHPQLRRSEAMAFNHK